MRNAALVASRPCEPSAFLLGLVLFGCRTGEPSPLQATPSTPSASSAAASPASQLRDPPADPQSLALPGPAAAPCTSDAMCLNHRCNVAYGKCAFPCASDTDCVRGTHCFKAVISTCQPTPPDQSPQ